MAIELSKVEWDNITEEMTGQTELLTKEEAEHIATRLNAKINLPVLGEKAEQTIFIKIVRMLDRYLYGVLPNEIYTLVRTVDQGISEEEQRILKKRLPPLMNEHINIPIISEKNEQDLIELFLDIVIDALQKDKTLALGN